MQQSPFKWEEKLLSLTPTLDSITSGHINSNLIEKKEILSLFPCMINFCLMFVVFHALTKMKIDMELHAPSGVWKCHVLIYIDGAMIKM